MATQLDLQGTQQLQLTTRRGNRFAQNIEVVNSADQPINVEDATSCELICTYINSSGKQLLLLDLDNGITIADNVITFDAGTPDFKNVQGPAWYKLVIVTPQWGTRTLMEGVLTII